MSQLEEVSLMFRLTLVAITLQLTHYTYQTASPCADNHHVSMCAPSGPALRPTESSPCFSFLKSQIYPLAFWTKLQHAGLIIRKTSSPLMDIIIDEGSTDVSFEDKIKCLFEWKTFLLRCFSWKLVSTTE